MIGKQATKTLYEAKGPREFTVQMYHLLGLTDAQGNPHRDHAGNPKLVNPQLRPQEFSLRDMAEAIIGPYWEQALQPRSRHAALLEETQRPLLEAGPGLDVTAFQNINAFTGVVGGLIEVRMLEAYQNPSFIMGELMPDEPTKMGSGQKIIGVSPIGDKAESRKPGMPTKKAGFGERWVTLPATDEYALAVEVTREAVFFDLTGDVLRQAESVGMELGYREELRCLDVFLGVTNSYQFNGTSYNTYVAAGTPPSYDNLISSNELVDWENVQTALLKFADMKDPQSSKRILINPNAIFVMPAKVMTARFLLGATESERRNTPGSNTAGTNVAPLQVTKGANPLAALSLTPYSSVLAYQRATDSDGLNLSASNAGKVWFLFEKGKSFRRMVNFPLMVEQAVPNTYELLDRGIVAAFFGRYRTTPSVWDPRYTIKCTG